jgi:glycerol-3-phosphate dehydrogenase (NAD(P)+)
MGSAFAVPLADNNWQVRLVGTHLDNEIIESVRRQHFHPGLRTHLPDTLVPYTHESLSDAIENADLVVLGVSSAGIDWAMEQLAPMTPAGVPIVMLTKGLRCEGGVIEILPSVVERCLPGHEVCAIGGPCIAGELAVRRQTSVALAGRSTETVMRLTDWLRTPYYHVWPETDLIGVELCAALKNFYALAVGMAAGMLESSGNVESQARMHDAAAALFTQALWEMMYLVRKLGGNERSVMTLAGAGDLYVTCQAGRNSRMGRWLGLGLRYNEAKAKYMSDETVEGGETAKAIAPAIEAMIGLSRIDRQAIPLAQIILDAVCRDAQPAIPWEQFFR